MPLCLITYESMLSTYTLELVAEWHNSQSGLDPVLTEEALVHDAIHAWCGLGTSLADEEIVLNTINLLAGLDCLPNHKERCEQLILLLPSEVVIELSTACSQYYA